MSDYAAGYVVTSDASGNASWHSPIPTCVVYLGSAQSLGSGAATTYKVPLDQVGSDPHSMFDLVNNRISVLVTGMYAISGLVSVNVAYTSGGNDSTSPSYAAYANAPLATPAFGPSQYDPHGIDILSFTSASVFLNMPVNIAAWGPLTAGDSIELWLKYNVSVTAYNSGGSQTLSVNNGDPSTGTGSWLSVAYLGPG